MGILAAGGYRLESVTPIDQFRFSPHVEIVGYFEEAGCAESVRKDRWRRDCWDERGAANRRRSGRTRRHCRRGACRDRSRSDRRPSDRAARPLSGQGAGAGASRDDAARWRESWRCATSLRIPLVPQGGNTGLVGGQTPDVSGGEIVLSLQRMNRVREVDAAANVDDRRSRRHAGQCAGRRAGRPTGCFRFRSPRREPARSAAISRPTPAASR